MDKITYNGKTYELPKKTMAIVQKEDAMYTKSASLAEQYMKQFEYAYAVLGEENIVEILGSSDVNEVDLSEITLLCNMIDEAYMKKINDQNIKRAEKMLGNKAVSQIISAGNAAGKIANASRYSKN